MAKKLTEKQRKFIDSYMGAAEGNGYQAALMAGYKGSRSVLDTIASENLRKPKIANAIEALQRDDPKTATREDRQAWFTALMMGWTFESTDPVTGETKTESFASWPKKERLKAAELLGKMSGDFITRIDARVAVGRVDRLRKLDDTIDLGELAHIVLDSVDAETGEEEE